MKKTAIITGESRGIGYAIAMKLGTCGFRVVITGVQSAEARKDSFKEFGEKNIEYLYCQSDVALAEDGEKLLKETLEKFRAIHVLVNNAGVAPKVRADILEMTEESFDYVVGTNTKGTMLLTQAVANQMLKQKVEGEKRGTIINISSCSFGSFFDSTRRILRF